MCVCVCVCVCIKMGARASLISKVHDLTDLLEMTPCMRKFEDPKPRTLEIRMITYRNKTTLKIVR